MINVAIFASGEGTNVENLIKHFATGKEVKIKLIVTNNPEAGVVKRAEACKKNIQIVSKEALSNYTEQLINFLQTEKTDLIVLAGFLLKVPEKIVKAFPQRIINIHPALLPAHGGKGMYGKRVHEAVLKAGDKTSGITIHYVDEEYDRGEHILQAACRVEKTDTPETLAEKIHELEYFYFPKAVEKAIERLKIHN
ncbi:MAG TPA: phosphoribosylglycinamide formyltransferase [Bacteroidia bacterium]|jgi:phosphoribosylglycinamide formyltransferase-1|nr:phosphoribosylglycinamide formyltransferase [Bacteroidia bacterium]